MYVKRVPFKEKISLKIQMFILKYIQNLHKSIIPENKQNKSYIIFTKTTHIRVIILQMHHTHCTTDQDG